MAATTFNLIVRERTIDGQDPTFVKVTVYPLAASDGTRLKVIKDTTGQVIFSGHAEVKENGSGAGEVSVTLPDPRDAVLSPTGFGYEVQVSTNYFTRPVVIFGPTDITAHIASGVVYLEDVTLPDVSAFVGSLGYATTADLAATLAAAEAYTDSHSSSGAVTSVNTRTGAVVLSSSDVGLGSVNNTADSAKPVSTAQATADAAVQAFAIQRANHTGTESADVLTDGTTNKAFLATERTKLTGIATGATANSTDATLLARANHTGTESADVLTDGTTNKAFLATERTKLAGIATGATANSTDATLLNRANHTGTQSLDTTTDSGTRVAMTPAERTKLGVTLYTTALANGTDQSTTLQAEADSLATAGGGRLMLPAGVVVGHVSLDASVVIEGRGVDATFLKRPSSFDGPVVQSKLYTTMVTTSGTGTTHDMGCRNLTIDGNRAAGGFTNPLAGTAPTTPTASTSTTGGTVPAGTQMYRIAPITAAGVGVASSPVSQVTTGSTSTVTVNWTAVTGATGYIIYGRTFNGTKITAVGAVTTWLDDGSLTPLANVNFKRSANLTAYPAVGLYGWRPVLEHVRIMGAPGPGLHATWFSPGGTPGTGVTMEAHLHNVTVESSGTNSVIWEGPHDSIFHSLIAAKPGQAAQVTAATTDNVVVEGGGPVRFVTSHAWGQSQYAFALYGQTDLTTCQAEGGLTGQVLLACPTIHLNGVEVFSPGGASAAGLVYGSSSITVTNVSAYGVHVYGFSSASGAAIDLTHAGTGCGLTGIIDQTTGTPITGSTPADMYVNVRVNGTTGGRFQVPSFPLRADSMSTNKLLGRGTSGTGAIEEITLGTNLTLSGTTLNAAGGGGTGDMLAATYDPTAKHADAFSQDQMADGTTNKNYTATEKTKLAGIATGATANSSDATLENRANHTGTQTASTISDLAAATNPLPGEAAPSDFGFTHWTFNPILVSSTGNMAAGNGFFTKLFVRQSATISTIYVYVGSAGVTLTNVGFALYDASSTLLTSSVNANGATTTAFQSVGLKPVTITPQAVTGPVYAYFWFTGTTTPALVRQAPTSALLSQLGLSSPNLTVGTAGTGLTTTAPSPMGTQSAATFAPWVALA